MSISKPELNINPEQGSEASYSASVRGEHIAMHLARIGGEMYQSGCNVCQIGVPDILLSMAVCNRENVITGHKAAPIDGILKEFSALC